MTPPEPIRYAHNSTVMGEMGPKLNAPEFVISTNAPLPGKLKALPTFPIPYVAPFSKTALFVPAISSAESSPLHQDRSPAGRGTQFDETCEKRGPLAITEIAVTRPRPHRNSTRTPEGTRGCIMLPSEWLCYVLRNASAIVEKYLVDRSAKRTGSVL